MQGLDIEERIPNLVQIQRSRCIKQGYGNVRNSTFYVFPVLNSCSKILYNIILAHLKDLFANTLHSNWHTRTLYGPGYYKDSKMNDS